jgi:hypothetical protein
MIGRKSITPRTPSDHVTTTVWSALATAATMSKSLTIAGG